LFADSHNISDRRNNYLSQLLNMHNISDVRQREIHAAQPLVPGPSLLEFGIVAKLKRNEWPSNHQISAEMIQASREMVVSVIHKLINSI
jgi:hypothetical protein